MYENLTRILVPRRRFLTWLIGIAAMVLNVSVGLPSKTVAADKSPDENTGAVTKYVCLVCGYEYDPAEGDPYQKIPPGTPFKELPDHWVCPNCGAQKSEFEAMK